MEKLVVIDGNSILNRAFYGIMSSKMLQTADGTYTNAVYGFLSILFVFTMVQKECSKAPFRHNINLCVIVFTLA